MAQHQSREKRIAHPGGVRLAPRPCRAPLLAATFQAKGMSKWSQWGGDPAAVLASSICTFPGDCENFLLAGRHSQKALKPVTAAEMAVFPQ